MKIKREFQSPNFGERPKGFEIDILLLHYTGMKTGQEALDRLCDPQAQVSAHYLIEEDGQIFQIVEEKYRAWHAGLASWQGQSDINSRSIGIEIVNPGHEWGYCPFPEQQIQAVIELCKDIIKRRAITPQRVLGHSDVAPERKEDPGELFDWVKLNTAGIGIYPRPVTNNNNRIELNNFLNELEAYGYALDINNPQSPSAKAAVTAFQRHFRPSNLDGAIDPECCQILSDLHSQLDDQAEPT